MYFRVLPLVSHDSTTRGFCYNLRLNWCCDIALSIFNLVKGEKRVEYMCVWRTYKSLHHTPGRGWGGGQLCPLPTRMCEYESNGHAYGCFWLQVSEVSGHNYFHSKWVSNVSLHSFLEISWTLSTRYGSFPIPSLGACHTGDR